MEALLSRRLCRVCLGQLLSARHAPYKMSATLLHKPIPSMVVTRLSSVRDFHSNTYWSRQYCTKKPEKEKINLADKAKEYAAENEKAKNTSKVPWIPITVVAVFGLVYAVLRNVKSKAEKELLQNQAVPMIKLSVGGDWELVNHDGQTMTNKDFLGQWVLLYFGFTHCPDVCPEELEKLVKAVNIVDNNKEIPNIKPLFVTVDEDRDTKPLIKAYLADFSPKILGFTGSKEQLGSIRKAYRVYSSKGPVDEDNDYIVDHSIITYLVNPDGDTVMYFSREKDMLEIARSIEKSMKLYQKLKT